MNNKTAKQRRAFTLIELLVVIAIIAILAALITWGAGRAATARQIKATQAELVRIQAAIDDYKEKLGFYPPDNTQDATIPPLFYELTGTKFDPNTSRYQPLKTGDEIDKTTINNVFKLGGFANSNPENTKDFLGSLKPSQYGQTNGVYVLVNNVKGPDGLNTWRYVSSKPTNNPSSYDLWSEIVVGGKTNIIGNWK